jgi:hypothetical protein
MLTAPRALFACMQVSLMDEGGSMREDLKLPYGTDEAEKLAAQLKADFADGKEITVTVLKVGAFASGGVVGGCATLADPALH